MKSGGRPRETVTEARNFVLASSLKPGTVELREKADVLRCLEV